MRRSNIIMILSVFTCLIFGALSASAEEPDMLDYTCTPIFQTEAVDPNIVYLLDNGAEMEQIIWHSDYNNGTDYTPTVAEADEREIGTAGTLEVEWSSPTPPVFLDGWILERTPSSKGSALVDNTHGTPGALYDVDPAAKTGKLDYKSKIVDFQTGTVTDALGASVTITLATPGGNGFFNDNGYTVYKESTNAYYILPILDDLTPDPDDNHGFFSTTNTFTINGRSVTLPYAPSTDPDGDGIKDNATRFRYSKNYLNWLFFYTAAVDLDGDGEVEPIYDGTALPDKTRFYYAKKAILYVALGAANKAYFGIWNFTSTSQGASPVQPLKKVVDAGTLDTAFVNNVNNMGTVLYSPLAEGLARIGGYYNSPSAETTDPVLYYCQDSFVIVISPGVSSEDQDVATITVPATPFGTLSEYDAGTVGADEQAQEDGYAAGDTYDLDNAADGIGEGNLPIGTLTLDLNFLIEATFNDGDILRDNDGVFATVIGTLFDVNKLRYTGKKHEFAPPKWVWVLDENEIEVARAKIDADAPSAIPTKQNGSSYLDDVAYYLHTHDIVGYRDGPQYVTTYTVGFMGDDLSNRFLINTSNNGNGNLNLYDESDLAYGKYHFTAEDPHTLSSQILLAVNDILERAASGTAVSVLATSGEGEGNLVQAYFRPTIPSGEAEVKWMGYLQSLWVDAYGYLREDTDPADRILDVTYDKIVTYFVDSETGDTMIKRFAVSDETPYPDLDTASYEKLPLDGIDPLWEAGKILHQSSASDRKIFTHIDKDKDGVVDESTYNNFDDSGEVVRFHTGSGSSIKPYLGVHDDPPTNTWSYLGATHDERVTNLINYIRGNDITDLRNRTIDGNVWKLGDIIHSTPVAISKPTDNYHIIYGDESYQAYYNAVKDRETVVYVGANDGMLRAFTSWKYDSASKAYIDPYPSDSSGASTYIQNEVIGDELWAFIPQCQLPHLKWLPSTDYSHVYYVDLKPKIFDAKILPDDTHYTDSQTIDDKWGDLNWGTFLLIGMNMGGKHIWAEGDFEDGSGGTVTETRHFYPSYACIDVTDPRNPKLLWERTYTDLELTTSYPTIVRVKDNWFAVFGSGPSADVGNCDGTSTKNGHIFVVDLATGVPYKSGANDWLFETNESNAFMNSPVSIDKGLNNNVDGIYFGEAYLDTTWKGKLYKVTVPWADASGGYEGTDVSYYSDDPLDSTNPWQCHPLFNVTRPITSSVALSLDTFGNVWLFVGSGRYFSNEDKTNEEVQYMFGIKDPFFNNAQATYYHNYASSLELEISDLFNADPYVIIVGGNVYDDQIYFGDWSYLLETARAEDGWIRSLTITRERILTKFAILGGIVLTPSFVPNDDPCGFSGDSYLYGQYYETGTAYYMAVFTQGTEEVETEHGVMDRVLDKTLLGMGKASSVGVHVGMESGAKGFIQQSTGVVTSIGLTPAFNIKSGLRSWQER